MMKTGYNDTEGPGGKAAQTKKGLGLSPAQVIAGGAAAAVASVIGGHLGLAGTVVGAFILSVVSAITLPLFRASLEKSHEQIKRVIPRRATEVDQTTRTQMTADTASIVRATSGKVSAAPMPLKQPWEGITGAYHAPHKPLRGRKAWRTIGGTAVIFLTGVGAILGIQSATGVSLSHGTGALQSGMSQAVSNTTDSKGAPAAGPKPSAPAVEPSTVPTDPATATATAPATDPTEQPTATPTLTSDPAPSAEPTAPASADTPVPSSTPHPAAGTPDGSSGADGADSQSSPGAGTPTTGALR